MSNPSKHRIFKLPMAAILKVLVGHGAEEAADPHTPSPQTAPSKQSYVLSYKELKSLKGISYSRQHLRRLEEAGAFPIRIRIGAKIGWYEHEIDEWVQNKADARSIDVDYPDARAGGCFLELRKNESKVGKRA